MFAPNGPFKFKLTCQGAGAAIGGGRKKKKKKILPLLLYHRTPALVKRN
jgi:hypothetical protein